MPNFLSQRSVNQELAKLNDNSVIGSSNDAVSDLDESLSIIDEQYLFNESWLNTYIGTIEPTQIDEGQKSDKQTYNELNISNDRMLFSLNQNQSILKDNDNQTFTFNSPNEQSNSNFSFFNNQTEGIYDSNSKLILLKKQNNLKI